MTRVLVVSDHSMFGKGLEKLLSQQEGIDLVSRITDVDSLPDCLEQHNPDIVFVGCSNPEDCPASAVMQTLRNGLVRGIICVNLEDDAAYVFRGERHVVEEVGDLVEMIMSQASGTFSPRSDCPSGSMCQGKEEKARTIQAL